MENTLENKSKFFALYWGKNVMKCETFNTTTGHGLSGLMNVDINSETIKENWFLELKPLSSISDEDAIAVINIYDGSRNKPFFYFQTKISPFNEVFRQVYWIYNSSCPNDDGYRVSANFSDNGITVINSLNRTEMHIKSIDYLRSRGYALPYLGLSVEELVNIGWIKLKGETK